MFWERFASRLKVRGAGVVGCVLVFALVVGAGLIGAQATGAVVRLQDGGAWLANFAQGSVTWVNGYAGQAGKTVPIGSLSSPFKVVQRPDGAYAVDENGKATLIDGAQLDVSDRPKQLSSGVRVLANGAATWVLDTEKAQVQRVDPDSLEPIGEPVAVEGVSQAVVDSEGYLWAAVPSQGVVVRIGDGAVGRTEVGSAGQNVTVAADEQGERVFAVNTTAGSTFSLHGDGEARSFEPLPEGSGGKGLKVDVGNDGRLLIGLDGRAVVVPADGEGRAVSLPSGTKVDQVEIVSGIGYVVDRDSDSLIKVDMGAGTGAAIPNVGSKDLDDVVAHGNLLYLNDSGGNQVKVVKPDGVIVPIEKYRPGQKPSKKKKKNQNNEQQQAPETPDPQTPETPDSEKPDAEQPRNNDKNDKNKGEQDKPKPGQDDEDQGEPQTPGPDVTPIENDGPPAVATPDPEATGLPEVTEEPEPTQDPEPTEEPADPPQAPVVAEMVPEDAAALVTWDAAQDRGSEITGYAIVVDNQAIVEVGAGERQYRLTDLTNGQQYGVQVRALSAAGDGDLSAVRYVTPSADLPGVPGGVSATAGDAQITVKWTAAQRDRSDVQGYTVAAVTTGGNRITVQAGATATQIDVPGLTNGTGYTVEVAARSGGGEGEYGRPADGQPGSAGNPVVPAGVPGQVTLGTPVAAVGSVDVSWQPGANGGSAITGFQVQVGNGAVQNKGAAERKHTAKDVSATADTTVKVRAVNAKGQGPWASVAVRSKELARKQMYQCKNREVGDIYMLDLDSDCNNPEATRWYQATPIFKALSTQQPGTVQLMRCMITKPRGIIRQQLQTCPAGSEANGGTAFWAWTSANANGIEIREYRYSGSENGGYYYAPVGSGAPSGFAATGRSFWT
ncbi:fibronectin type III domain-containing protein [Kineosporia rhizophila]|uniref:fibronectin type III domain-containing protein n=1 Tax=Kineosporia rhizophila TaxID=84633 RepID=UPI001E602884|nr:fibronectin type III domain-containing protein [Kineosporia rhizophila]